MRQLRKVFPIQPEFFICLRCGVEKIDGMSVFRGITDILYDYEGLGHLIKNPKYHIYLDSIAER
jgi:hypothetical protein